MPLTLRCLRCKSLGCDMQPIPSVRIVEYDTDAGWYPSYYGDSESFGGHARDLGPATACTRCHHYGGSVVCGGRRDRRPSIWRRWPRLYRSGAEWRLAFWWHRELWIARGAMPFAAFRQAWQHITGRESTP